MLGVAEVCDENDASMLVISGAENRKTWAIKNALVDGFTFRPSRRGRACRGAAEETPFVVMDVEAGPEVIRFVSTVVTALGAPRNTFLTLATAALQFFQCSASRPTRSGIRRPHRSSALQELPSG